jgi:hypothetical protein
MVEPRGDPQAAAKTCNDMLRMYELRKTCGKLRRPVGKLGPAGDLLSRDLLSPAELKAAEACGKCAETRGKEARGSMPNF